MIDRRTFIVAIGGTLLPASRSAHAQTEGKVRKIGFLGVSPANEASFGGMSHVLVSSRRCFPWLAPKTSQEPSPQ